MYTRKATFIFFLALLLVTIPLFSASAEDLPKRTVNIGYSGPLSGSAASWGLALGNALKYYAEQSNNAGGMKLGGELVFFKVIAMDDKYLPSETIANTTKMIHVNEIDYMFTESGPGTMAIREMTTKRKLLTFSGGWADFLGPKYPRLFRFIIDHNASTLSLASYVKKNNPQVKTVVVINMDNDTGYSSGEGATAIWEGMNVEVFDSLLYDIGTVDFFPVVTKLLVKKPDFIDLSCCPPADVPLIVRAARDLGYKGDFAHGGMPDIPIDGVIATGIVLGDPKESPAQIEYRKAYSAKHGELHSWWEFYGSGIYPFFKNFLIDADSADPEVVYQTISAPGYSFDTWWGRSFWYGKDIWGIDRNLASYVPIKKGIGGKWVQVGYAQTKDYMPLYKFVSKDKK
jgi:branched-chain amino acid transport system substrate-binding protein